MCPLFCHAGTPYGYSMNDLPCIVLAATVWAYWTCVVVMSLRVRRRTRKLSGIVPSQRTEQLMWLVWVPLVFAWMALPYVAAASSRWPWALPALARDMPLLAWRWAGAAVGLGCLGLSIECWSRMGKNWRMAVAPDEQTDLVTTGLYGRVRHPIYALSILLMLCTMVVAPTLPVALMAVIHIGLMIAKARNEEHFLARRHGARYLRYLQRTGRFLPRLGARGAAPDDS
jgi:protein-S-isoprenylcysteine O-methyltransferase Ste14